MINTLHMTISELKVANSIYLNNFFKGSEINKYTAHHVRRQLRKICPKIFY